MQISGRGLVLKVVTAAGLCVGGCALNAQGEQTSETVESAEQGLSGTYQSSWGQGQPATDLGPTNDRFCFLTGVEGKFEGGSESVHVQIGSNNRWQLTGSSAQSGVGGYASCAKIPGLSYFNEQSWNASDGAPKWLGSALDRVCLLTGVKGKFAGGNETVQVLRINNDYYLTGGASQIGVGGWARCLSGHTPSASPDFTWRQGANQTLMFPAAWVSGGSDNGALKFTGWACGLTRMTGKFQGSGEIILVSINSGNSNSILFGESQQSGVAASANCFN